MVISETKRLSVLIVDDEPAVCRSIKMLLQHEGHDVQMADSGETGLALFEQGAFDLVITDYFMGGMNGNELAARVKQLRPGQPVIMATASVYGRNSAEWPENVDFLLNKPFTLQEMRDAIARVMR
jgi:CheY-like chemotaxis protein